MFISHHSNFTYKGLQAKLEVVVRRCLLVGMDLPSEPTTGHVVSVLVNKSGVQLSPTESHALLLDFKRKLKAAFRCGVGETKVTDFPIDPRDMPQTRFEFAYNESPPVSPQSVPLTPSTATLIPLRRTASTLRQASSTVAPVVNAPGPVDATNVAQLLMSLLQGQGQQLLPNLQVFRPSPKRVSWRLADQTTMPALTDAQHEPSADSPDQHRAADVPHQPQPPPLTTQATTSMFLIPKPMTPEDQSKLVANALAARSEANNNDNVQDKPVKGKGKKPVKQTAMKKKSESSSKASSSSSSKSTTKPSSPNATRPRPAAAGQTVFFAGGKIHRSDRVKGWRVFIRASDRVDKAAVCFFSHTYLSDSN